MRKDIERRSPAFSALPTLRAQALGLLAATLIAIPAMAQAQSSKPAPAQPDKVIAKVQGVEIHESDLAMAEEDMGQQVAQLQGDAKRDALVGYLADVINMSKAAEAKKAATAAAANDAKLATEPVSIYISRATQKLYVRRNTHKRWPDGGEVFDFSIEVPVTIRNPEKPIGTHVFTAMARNGEGLRWTAVTIDNGDEAKDALDRITMPKDILDRIAPTTVPRSSIVISDEPLSAETNYRTEFVAVLSNQPQGGFITRKPTQNMNVASDGDSGFPFFGIGGNSRRRGGGWW